MRRLTLALFVLALLAGGCGRDSAISSDSLRKSVAATKNEKTARFSLVIAITQKRAVAGTSTSGTVAAQPEVVELKASGLWNMAEDLVSSKVSYSTTSGGAGADYLVIKDVVYVSGLQAPEGKWRAFDSSQGGVGQDSLGVLRPDPAFETLAGVAKKAAKVGSEKLGGVETTHYKGVADLEQAVKLADAETRSALKARLDNTEGKTAAVDVWLDKEGRVRRLVTFTTAKGGRSTFRTTLNFSAFGVKADIKAPAPADIDSPVPAS